MNAGRAAILHLLSRSPAHTLLCLTFACADPTTDAPAPAAYAFTDSAGVILVENSADTASLPVWRLDTVPTLRVGSVDGGLAESFGSVSAAARLSDGSIVMGDNQAWEIKSFSADGSHRWTVGRRGSGPGEYRQIYSVRRVAADSVVVLDTFLQRVTMLSPEGETVRVVPLRPPASTGPDGRPTAFPGLRPVQASAGGGWIAVAQPASVLPPGHQPPALVAQPVVVLRYDDAGRLIDTVAVAAGVATLFARLDASQLRQLPPGAVPLGYQVMRPGATLDTWVALAGDRFFVGESTHFEVKEYLTDGTLVRRIRYPRLDRPYPDEEFAARRERAYSLARDDERRRALDIMTDPTWKPAMRPSFDALEVDERGNVWTREWGGDPGAPIRWLVLDAQGVAMAVAEIPRGTSVRDIGSEYVISVDRDAQDVPYVSVRRWIKADSPLR